MIPKKIARDTLSPLTFARPVARLNIGPRNAGRS
jgi:hypothetical protein